MLYTSTKNILADIVIIIIWIVVFDMYMYVERNITCHQLSDVEIRTYTLLIVTKKNTIVSNIH